MWMKLYIIVLDELINYLDNEMLVVLIVVFRRFKGGVLIISYNVFFVGDVCLDIWCVY